MVPAGGSRWQAEAGIEDSPARFREDIARKTGGSADARLSRALTEVAPELVAWLADHVGVPLELVTDFGYPGHSRHRCHAVPDRAGRTLQQHLLAAVRAAEDRITLAVPLALEGVERDGTGAVRGARVAPPGGERGGGARPGGGAGHQRLRRRSRARRRARARDRRGPVLRRRRQPRRRAADRRLGRRRHRVPGRLPGPRLGRRPAQRAGDVGDDHARRRARRPRRPALRRRDDRLLGVRRARARPPRRRGVARARRAHRRAVPGVRRLRAAALGQGACGGPATPASWRRSSAATRRSSSARSRPPTRTRSGAPTGRRRSARPTPPYG